MATASRSSAPERGQASPTAALVAVAAVGLGLSLYATVFAGVAPTADRELAEPTLSRVHDVVAPAGVATAERLDDARAAGPAGWSVRVELRAGSQRWSAGDVPPPGSEFRTAGRHVPVRTAPGRVRAGWLRVVVHR
ncbi:MULTISPECIES: DUF7285 family protein [Halolamina]|uniref:DUF7285 family protein n=1 Tax=Halolamina TaxID=1075397 RepID=UPI0009453341|nr:MULTISPECIES: hypothetical protein [Halolamina]NHX35644.1 hypothetical protein [Halolamina sp. R1-12]